jgi:IS5 family transposase
MKRQNIGSSVDSWLEEEGILEETTALAVKRVVARQIAAEMTKQKLSNTAMAKRMGTSRVAVDRLLDPTNQAVTLKTLSRAATAVGRTLHLELV